MKIDRHVMYAIDDFKSGRKDAALMHACMAIDGTAKKLFGLGGKSNYKNCLRRYYWVISFMLGGGPNLDETFWKNASISDGFGRAITKPDLADVIYHVFRCSDAHGDIIPEAYSLTPSSDGHCSWYIAKGEVHMPDRILWALLAVAVFSRANADIATSTVHMLRWGSDRLGLGFTNFPIKDWWGREGDFRSFVENHPQTQVTIEKMERLGAGPVLSD